MKTIILLAINLMLAGAASAAATDETAIIEHGEKLLQQHCTKCHTDEVYTRPNHFIKSLPALKDQVDRCKNNTGAPWFDEDTEAVVRYLNSRYYRF